MKNKYILVLIVVGAILFFWFAIRPSIIRSVCANKGGTVGLTKESRDEKYTNCLHSYGL